MPQTSLFIDSFKYDPDYHRFADYLGMDKDDRNDMRVAKKLALLYDWAAVDTGKQDMESVVGRLEKLRKQEGVTFTGKELATFLYQRVRLDMDKVRQAANELDKRVKAEQSRRELDKQREEGREWRKKQEMIKESLSQSTKVSQEKLDRYLEHYQKTQPKFDKVEKIPNAPKFDSKTEYV